jgi:hypothetical protein
MSYYSDEGATAEDGQGNNITSYITKIVQKYNAGTSSWDTIAKINGPHSNPWDVPYISKKDGDKYKIIYNVKDINNIAAESKTRLININAPQPELIPGTVVPAYQNGAPENLPIPLHDHIMSFNWAGMFSDLSGSSNPWSYWGDTEHQFWLRHPASYYTKDLWDFMRLPSLEVEVKACDPWTDFHSFSNGSSSRIHYQNRFRFKDTNTGEYWNWGPQKNFDFGMANGEWSNFVPFGSSASLSSFSLDPDGAGYMDLRAGLQTIANGGGAPAPYSNTQGSAFVNSILGLGNTVNVAYGGTYNSETNTFQVSVPSMESYIAQDPYYSGTLPTTYAEMWSSTQAIASAAALEGVPALTVSQYESPGGMPWAMNAFYPNLITYGRSGHAWMQAYIAYLSAGLYYALNEPVNPDLSEFFSEDSVQYRYPIVGNTAVPPKPGVKSIKGSDPNLIVEHASSDHYDEHGVPVNNDFKTYTQGLMSQWLVPLVGDHWYIPSGTSKVKADAPDTYICGYVPPYFN